MASKDLEADQIKFIQVSLRMFFALSTLLSCGLGYQSWKPQSHFLHKFLFTRISEGNGFYFYNVTF